MPNASKGVEVDIGKASTLRLFHLEPWDAGGLQTADRQAGGRPQH